MSAHVQLFTTLAKAGVKWRLLSGNNREVGRGEHVYADVEAAVVGIKQLQLMIGDFDQRIRHVPSGQWRWELLANEEPAVGSARGFDRQIRCELAMQQFLTLFDLAPIGDGVMVSG